jgi:predicted secreted acid phosphatase
MKRHLTFVATAAVAAAIPLAVATAKEPSQPATADTINKYHDSGQWDKDIDTVVAKAKKSLTTQLKAKKAPKKPSIVFDIDDTLESSYACEKKSTNGFGPTASAICVATGDQTPIKQTKALYKYALKKKINVFLITGRPEGLRDATVAQLKKDGFGKYKELDLRPNNDPNKTSVVPYKSGARKAIEKKGFTILANLGDQKSDLAGGFSVKTFKIPNPMYTTP